jgi:hypothetical protein
MCGLGLVAMAIAAVAYLRGADVLAGFAGSKPPLLPLVTGVTDDERTQRPSGRPTLESARAGGADGWRRRGRRSRQRPR